MRMTRTLALAVTAMLGCAPFDVSSDVVDLGSLFLPAHHRDLQPGTTGVLEQHLETWSGSVAGHDFPAELQSDALTPKACCPTGQTCDACDPESGFSDVATFWSNCHELTLEILMKAAFSGHPSIEIAEARWKAQAEKYPQLTSLDDPYVRFLTGPNLDIGKNGNLDDFRYRFEVRQTLPWFGKRSLRGKIALANTRAAALEINETELSLMELIKLAFFDYLTSCWQMAIQDQRQALHNEYTQWLHSQAALGAIDERLLLDADLETRKLRRKYEQDQWRQQQAGAKINLLVGQPPDIPVPAPRGLQIWHSFDDGDLLQSRAIECRTQLQVLHAQVESAQHRVDLMKRGFFPDFQPMLRFDTIDRNRGSESLTTLVGFNVYAPLAIKRRQGALHEAEADLVRVRAELRQQTSELRHAVHIANGHLNEAHAALQFSFSTIELAERAAQSAHQRFENGHAEFAEVWSTQRKLLDERSEQCSAYLNLYQRLVFLERTTGVPLLIGRETQEETE